MRQSGRDRILAYLQDHLGEAVSNATLRDESGIDDVPRAIRMLRQMGWDITSHRDGTNTLNRAVKGAAKGRRLGVSEKVRYQVLHNGHFRCRACGATPSDGIKLVVDHIVPVDWGGSSDIDNLQPLCEKCNQGKQAWVSDLPTEAMREVFKRQTVQQRIEALFDQLPNQDVPSLLIQLVSGNALDWQRALRRIRQKKGKHIVPTADRKAYRYSP